MSSTVFSPTTNYHVATHKYCHTKALFSSKIFREKTVDSPSHRIFGHMHGALNIDKK
jgi:hypothetical protein